MKFREHGTVQAIGTGAVVAGGLGFIGAGITALGEKGGKVAHEAIMQYWYVPAVLFVAGAVTVGLALWKRE